MFSAIRDRKELRNGEPEIRNPTGISKKYIHFSPRAEWVKWSYFVGWQILLFLGPRFIPNHRKCIQRKKDAIFGWLVGGLSGIWLVCGWFSWFVGDVAGLWVVQRVCGWFRVLQLTNNKFVQSVSFTGTAFWKPNKMGCRTMLSGCRQI